MSVARHRRSAFPFWPHGLAVAAVAALVVTSSHAPAIEPYPFKTRPRDIDKQEFLSVDFEGALPEGTELGKNAKVEEKAGTGGTKGLVSQGKGLIVRFPINKTKVDISRFELLLDYAGPGFSLFKAKLVAYDNKGKLLRSVDVASEWGISPAMRTWEMRKVNLEFEDIHAVALEIEQTNDDGEVKLDNIILRRYDLPSMLGRTARKDLTLALKQEGLKVDDVSDIWVGTGTDRYSYFDFKTIDENKRYVRSDWHERLHVGTTYKTTNGKLPTFVLGVSAREAALEAAAARQKKTLADMHKLLVDDVKAHGFNAIWCDFTKDLEKFDQQCAAAGISLILKDPGWSGLEAWVAKPTGPMPDEFKTRAKANLERYAKLKSLVGYQVNRPLNKTHQAMLAEARKYLASIAPNVQLVSQDSDVYAAENIEQPYPNLGIQFATFQQYAGRPWIAPSYFYHPNYWPVGISEGWYRRIHDAYHVRTIPNLWGIPSGRTFSKNTITMQADQIRADATGWVQDEKTKRWSGWMHYDFPPNLMRSTVWTAIEAGAAGVLVDDWGPADIPADVKGTDITKDTQYKDGVYRPDTLRRFDLSESDEWKELGEVAKEISGLKLLFADTTTHGHNAVKSSSGDVRARTLTGRDDPFKVVACVNTKIGQYDAEKLKLNPDTGAFDNYEAASPITFNLTVEKDYGLIDMQTGKLLDPKSTNAKDKSAVYEIALAPGEGKLFFRGKSNLYTRFAQKYKIQSSGTASADTGSSRAAK